MVQKWFSAKTFGLGQKLTCVKNWFESKVDWSKMGFGSMKDFKTFGRKPTLDQKLSKTRSRPKLSLAQNWFGPKTD